MAFTKHRTDLLNSVLENEPYVFISGVSGVGKSTFIRQDFCGENDVLFEGEQALNDWAHSIKNDKALSNDKRKILFIDEANLSHNQWSQFEGLFQTPKTILVGNELIELSDNHKVVFAGNPLNYGDERQQAPLFEHHGNAVLFEPLNKAFLYQKLLKPVFGENEYYEDAIHHILEVYQSLCGYSTNDILISPRELQMMALLIRNTPPEKLQESYQQICYDIAKNCVPKANQKDFDDKFLPPPTSHGFSEVDDFIITPSRQAVTQQIDDLLSLRDFRQHPENSDNAAIIKGGLGGIILEGEPGIGKTVQVIKQLRAQGFEQETDLNNPTTKTKPYYVMPVSMPYEEKEKLLLKAFDEGAVVMIDEINASPMMERLLNDLLMGHRPTNTDGTPEANDPKPGFLVIGTQNPITMSGRRAPSTALQRRMITTVVPEYQTNEMIHILEKKGIPHHESEKMVELFQKNRSYALKHLLSPAPTFRDLEKIANDFIKSGIQAIYIPQYETPKPEQKTESLIANTENIQPNTESKPRTSSSIPEKSFTILTKEPPQAFNDFTSNKDLPSENKWDGISQEADALKIQTSMKKSFQALKASAILVNQDSPSDTESFSPKQFQQLLLLLGKPIVAPDFYTSNKQSEMIFSLANDENGNCQIALCVSPSGNLRCIGLNHLDDTLRSDVMISEKMVSAFLIASGALFDPHTNTFDLKNIPITPTIETPYAQLKDALQQELINQGVLGADDTLTP